MGNLHFAINLTLVVDKTAELTLTLAGVDGDVQAFDAGVGQPGKPILYLQWPLGPGTGVLGPGCAGSGRTLRIKR